MSSDDDSYHSSHSNYSDYEDDHVTIEDFPGEDKVPNEPEREVREQVPLVLVNLF